jgi:prepilin-type N-terminal cleavage/methylation domain-containing protein/prepilin-type processing-associated H-X9-DG protein
MSRRARTAFTLIELLVVMAIIGVLAALAFGAVGKVTSFRQQTESAALLRQWGAALGPYAAENDGALPRRGQGVQPVTQLDRPEDWFNALPPYLGLPGYGALVSAGRKPREGDRSIFLRPGAKDPGGVAFLGYGMNMNLSPWNLSAPTRLSQIERPAVTVFLAEGPGNYASTYPSSRAFSCVAPHAGKGNVLFLDGHVAAFEGEYLGVGKGDPLRSDVRWLTGTTSDAQAANYR